jgi:trimethylamine---corrinoid protein Co-methyltransferase
MIPHPRVLTEQLSPDGCRAVHDAALRILESTGFAVNSPEALRILVDAGARTDAEAGRAWFPPGLTERLIAGAPRTWRLHARNPERSVEAGAAGLLVCPGYGSPSVADARGRRRPASLRDFMAFAAMAGRAGRIDVTGGLLVEPMDVPAPLRALETTRALLVESDKPFLGSVAGAEGARDSLALARIVHPDMDGKPVMMGLVNINSPLRLDARMAEALIEYARAAQPVLLTPGILMGVTAPVTAAGSAAQALAELMACTALVQAVRPGAPVMIGTGGFGADLRTGGPGFGRPENALGTLLGAQLARRFPLPFRCSGAVTGSRLPDCRSGYERMMTALAAWTAGAHLCLQGAGTLDSINSMSYEQFVIDLEIWGYIGRLAEQPRVDADGLALEEIAALPADYLGSGHTVDHMRREMLAPLLATPLPYDEWARAGSPGVIDLALPRVEELGQDQTVLPLPAETRKELDARVNARRKALGG